jgi:rhodanese-related sulfurtransferase
MTANAPEYPPEIDVCSVKKLFDEGEKFLLLDCREVNENQLVKIAGSTHIPMREIQQRLGDIETHKAGRIVVHCHHGGRSQRVTEFLRQQGYAGAQNMAGGIDAWAVEIDPTLPRY